MRYILHSLLALLWLPVGIFAADRPNNPIGVHLMIRDIRTDENIDRHTAWARRVCGPWGYVKIFEYGITPETQGPPESLVKLVNTLYERELIPVLRLGGVTAEGQWQRPVDTPDGSFGDVAEAFKRVVAGVPRSDECPFYVEVWNEPNLGLEWSGTPDPADFAKMYVRAAKAIRSIGDERIQVAPGAMSPGGQYNSLKFIDAMCQAEPEFIRSFDYWATHPYPGATPPEYNIHDQTTTMQFACIDLWLYELQCLANHGCDISSLKVIGTETGYRRGHGGDGEYPMIDTVRRADYHLRTIRDYWTNWPEVLGMCIWDFANPFEKFNDSTWVHADSTTDETGWPSMPTLDFEYVAALAKPGCGYACVSGRLTDARTGGGIPGVELSIRDTELKAVTDRLGNFVLSPVDPRSGELQYLTYRSASHGHGRMGLVAREGQNVVVNKSLGALILATLEGHVIDTATGTSFAGALVTAEPGHFGTRSDDQGRFVLNQLPHGHYDVTVAAPNFYPHRQKTLRLVAGDTLRHTYRLGPGREPHNSLVTNGGFESSEADASTPLGWGAIGTPQRLSIDHQAVYAGDQSVRIRASGDGPAGVIQWTGYTTIREGRRYRLQCWMRAEGVKAAHGKGAWLAGTVVTNPHETLAILSSETKLTGDTDWTLLTVDFTAPADAGRVSLEVRLDAETGSALADEAAVIPLD